MHFIFTFCTFKICLQFRFISSKLECLSIHHFLISPSPPTNKSSCYLPVKFNKIKRELTESISLSENLKSWYRISATLRIRTYCTSTIKYLVCSLFLSHDKLLFHLLFHEYTVTDKENMCIYLMHQYYYQKIKYIMKRFGIWLESDLDGTHIITYSQTGKEDTGMALYLLLFVCESIQSLVLNAPFSYFLFLKTKRMKKGERGGHKSCPDQISVSQFTLLSLDLSWIFTYCKELIVRNSLRK